MRDRFGSVEQTKQQVQKAAPNTSELIEHLSCFEGSPSEFLYNLLVVQCHLVSATSGAVLRYEQEGRVEVLVSYPPLPKNSPAPVWLAQAVESGAEVFRSGTTAVKPLHGTDDLYGQPSSRYLVFLPIKREQQVNGVAVFVLDHTDRRAIEAGREKLELTVSLLSMYQMRLVLQQRELDLHRLHLAMAVLSSVNAQAKFHGAAMSLCNEIATQWQCERVGFGLLNGRYVHLKAMSHTEKFSRKMQLVQDIEAAMEECFDQDIETLYPTPADATYVSRAATNLAKRHGPSSVACLPLRQGGETVGVITLERSSNKPFMPDDLEALRLMSDLTTARQINLFERDRWFGAKIAASSRKSLSAVVGPKHTWAKLIVAAVLLVVILLVTLKGDFEADAPFMLEATTRQVVAAPFEGFLKTVNVKPGSKVVAGQTVLGTLDDSELKLQKAAYEAERMAFMKEASAASRDGKTGESQVARAQADKKTAEIELLEYRIKQAKLVSPITGTVVAGDLERQLGAPVKTGDMLFDVAPLETLRAELYVPEDEIAEVKVGQVGELATTSYPDQRIEFVVEHIFPVAEVKDQRNVYKVRVKLDSRQSWMKPGMEGVAKVNIGRRTYAWLWTRKMVNWIRMKFWL